MTMKDTSITEEIGLGEEILSELHSDASNCDCPKCTNVMRHNIQILDIEQYVKHLNGWE